MEQDIKKYKKWRILRNWLLKYTFHSAIIIAVLFNIFLFADALIPGIRISTLGKILLYIAAPLLYTIYHSFELIRRLEAEDIHIVKEGSVIQTEEENNSELEYGFPEEIMDENHKLKVSMAEFVRYCYKNKYYEDYTRAAWKPIHNKILNNQGKPISAKQLAQSYQDEVSKGHITPRN